MSLRISFADLYEMVLHPDSQAKKALIQSFYSFDWD